MSVFQKILKAGEGKRAKQLAELVGPINELSGEMAGLTDAELRAKTDVFKERLAEGETLDDLLIEAYAVVREAASRVLGQRHYDVQLMGGMALHFGWIAEMKTGEGKTLVSTLPVYLNALAGQGVHVVTVNDYLATRDANWMGQLHRWLGLSVGRVGPDLPDFEQKRDAYLCDITYGTNTEFGFDYLRDNMARRREHMVQRGHHFAIVDEVDSILIDEARTPLIISGPAADVTKLYYQFASIARTLVRDQDYEVDEEKKTVIPTEAGIEKVERLLGVNNLYDAVATNYVHQLGQALRAKELFHRDKEYLVDAGVVKIVDEFTGRTLDGRRWSDGLHQAVEAKERVRIQEENHTWATVTLQNYFRLYEKMSGMTGTAETEAGEFGSTYNLPVVPIPTHRPNSRQDLPDLIYKTEAGKIAAIIEEVRERNTKGQPVLLGTASVEKSELISRELSRAGIAHEVLNAKHHFREAEIVAQAGRKFAVTVATNMAGRGVDVILGGNPEGLAVREVLARGVKPDDEGYASQVAEAEAKFKAMCDAEGEEVRALGGLYVLGSERHDSRRIDNQLRGRSGRQGDPGESRFFLSLEDDLLRLFATGAVSWVMGRTMPEDVPIEAKMVSKAIERAQNTVEGRNAEIRKDVLKYDEVMNEQRKVIYGRRQQVIDGEDIHDTTIALIEEVLGAVVERQLDSEFYEEWDLRALLNELMTYYPVTLSEETIAQYGERDDVVALVLEDALTLYQSKCESFPDGLETAKEIERDVMLQVVDQRWREHLSDMDYLRDGIYLRQVAQQDPLTAWQKEGYELFEALLVSINHDYVRYITHVEAQVVEEEAVLAAAADAALESVHTNVDAVAPGATEPAHVAAPKESPARATPKEGDKIGRNDPCWCGSGRKFKQCHGRP
ncbi:MAG: preprotein translocase subunit SecA [Acidobacteriota bacterium]|nr:preprotein translocase subunit SecA [Acidobacteriota bacterium]MDE3139288.1 preprotein translocase subunit SecA [Acidobacteriota bacterium]MDE3147255.1 preprotein translocase subunit SecA [Acidobacteriota bacterium]